jgi:hypothetical protein
MPALAVPRPQLMPLSGKRRYLLSLVLLCVLLPGPAGFCAAPGTAPASQLVRLARTLEDAPDPMRSDFAWLALSEMVDIYTEQAARARLESRGTGRARDQARWAASVDAYAAQMQALANGFTPDTRVRITAGPGNDVYVYVDGRPIIVTGVIDGQQAVYEQRVLERFCLLYLCPEVVPDSSVPAALPATAGADVLWSFSQHAGPACITDDGLEFQFRDLSEIIKRRRACEQVVADLTALAAAIARKIAAGVRVDWNSLVIQSRSGEARHRVLLNQEGATIQLALPALGLLPDLFRIMRPWLAAKAGGNSYRLVVLNAGRLVEPLTATYE